MYRTIGTAIFALALSGPALAQNAAPTQFVPPVQSQAERDREMAAMVAYNKMPDTQGTGAYPAMKEEDPGLPDHVVYRPIDLAKFGKGQLGIVAWGNGGCSKDGASMRFSLAEIASHGYVVIAPGKIYSGPGAAPMPPRAPDAQMVVQTTTEQVKAGYEWALAENARPGSPYYGKIDSAKLAVSGSSCGGIQAVELAGDPRVKAVVIHNSGIFPGGSKTLTGISATKATLATLHTPVIYIMGGPKDIAYGNATDDFKRIGHVPMMMVNEDTGHGGTFLQPNGGPAAQVTVQWLEWQLRGDPQAEKYFVGKDCGICRDTRWTVERKNFPGGAQ
jgi:hypothetical protein